MSEPLRIRLRHDSAREQGTAAALERVMTTYDLEGLVITRDVEIDETGRPHSHPDLTLTTQYEHDEHRLLAEFVHEQLHWFEETHGDQRDIAIARTKELYPSVPSDPPEAADDENSTRLHLLVCYLEYQALKCLIGAHAAHETIDALSRHHYRWVYRTVLQDEAAIGRLIDSYFLRPARLRACMT
jgi:hypothetical protein